MSIHKYAQNGDDKKLAELLEKSAVSLNEESSTQKRTHGAPLHDAASNGHHKCLLVLLDHGADPNLANSTSGSTPLHLAAEFGHVGCMATLIQRGAQVKATDSFGWTPLHVACRSGKIETVRQLLPFGAPLDLLDNHNHSALFYSAQRGDIATIVLLIENGAEYVAKESSSPLKALHLSNTQIIPPPASSLLESLSSDFTKLVNNKIGADVTFYLEDNPIYAHRCILSVRAPSFVQKYLPSSESDPVTLEEFTYGAFYAFLEYLYTGSIRSFRSSASQYQIGWEGNEADLSAKEEMSPHLKTDELLFPLELASLANTCQVPELSTMCLSVICNHLNASNFIQFLTDCYSGGFSLPEPLEAFCGQVFVQYVDEISREPDFIKLGRDRIIRMLSLIQPNPHPVSIKPKPEVEEQRAISPIEPAPLDGAVPARGGAAAQKNRGRNKRKRGGNETSLKGKNLQHCRSLIRFLLNHPSSIPFREPVDVIGLAIPDYLMIIKQPMDLGTINARLKKDHYASRHQFASDVNLVFNNAKEYNRTDSEIYRTSDELQTHFETKYNATTWEDDEQPMGMDTQGEEAPLASKTAKRPATKRAKVARGGDSRSRRKKEGESNANGNRAKPRAWTNEKKLELASRINELEEPFLVELVKILQKGVVKKESAGDDTVNVEIDMEKIDDDTLSKVAEYVNGLDKRAQE